jgi:putative ABC transport system permease protein
MLFALFAAFLAILGLYGVMSLAVAQRARELGIRIALGAEPNRILRLVLGQGMRLALVGESTGIFVGLGAGRLMRILLYEVKPDDPLVFVSVALLLTTVSLVACYVPARRAMRESQCYSG